ncbi:MAG TPA: phytoene desaturase [Rhodospirillaceae bacterium]|nr:phytoene desaturase [Rhodospirillaceae bacterium]
MTGRRHAVVIGSGFGGLAAAVRLGARGYRVTVLERLRQPGGRAGVFRQDGFTFDAGPTIITAPFMFEELWQLCGRSFSDDIKMRAMDLFYRIIFDDGSHFDCLADDDAMRREVARVSPGDVRGFERFLRYSEAVYRIGFEELGDKPFSSIGDMLRIAPDLFRFGALRSVHATVSKYVEHPYLRFALSFHPLFVGGNPFATTSVYCLISFLERHWGVSFAMGGTGALVRGLVDLIEGQGGTVRCGSEVTGISVEAGKASGVRLASGEVIASDIVVSNADVAWTYKTLLAETPRKRWTDRKLSRSRHSMSLFVWYFGTKKQYSQVPHHTILLGPRYRGLVEDIFRCRGLAADFSLYLHHPTVTDPSLAPDGCDTFYVLSPVPNLDAGIDWATQAEPYRRAIEERLSERLLPGLRDQIISSRVFTPQDFRDQYLSVKGAAFGFQPLLTQSAWFRPHNRSEDVDGLYLVGAGTHPGAGVPGVLSSARVLDSIVPHAGSLA